MTDIERTRKKIAAALKGARKYVGRYGKTTQFMKGKIRAYEDCLEIIWELQKEDETDDCDEDDEYDEYDDFGYGTNWDEWVDSLYDE